MILAVIGDIGGNLRALQAVLEAMEEEGIQTRMHCGNSVLGAMDARNIIQALNKHALVCIQGTRDKDVVRFHRKRTQLQKRLSPEDYARLEACHNALSSADLEWLRQLRKRSALTMDGLSLLLCHGSPTNPAQVLSPDSPIEHLKRQREAHPVDVILCGGGSAPYSRMVDGTLFVNPGPVDAGARQARWAIVNTESEEWQAEFRIAQYDEDEEE